MFELKLNPGLTEKIPHLRLFTLQAPVSVQKQEETLNRKIESDFDSLRARIAYADISKQASIQKGRSAYRALGKDPTRYRLSSEKLLRRILKGETTSGINTLVDLSNAISAISQCPIGTFDGAKIDETGPLIIDIGREGERYNTLSELDLNLEGLIVIRDAQGAFGSTTSDSNRTAVGCETQNILMVVYILDENLMVEEIQKLTLDYLAPYLQDSPVINMV